MEVLKKIRIDLSQKGNDEVIYAVQLDSNSRVVEAHLFSSGLPWQIPPDSHVSVAFKKKDGTNGWYDTLPDGSAACSVQNNVVTSILAPEVLTVEGECKVCIIFQDSELNQLATFPFCVLVAANPAVGGVISNNYYNLQTLGQINDAIEDLQRQVDSIIDDSTVSEKAWSSQRVMEAISEEVSFAAIICNISGSAISVFDASNRHLRGLTLYGKTTQSGTPTPDAPIPLESAGASGSIGVTVAGKNFFNNSFVSVTRNGVTFTVNEDGSIKTSGTASEDTYIKVGEAVLESGVKYTLSGCPSGGSTTTYMLYNNSKGIYDLGSGNSFTADGSVYEVWLKIGSGCPTSNLLFKPMLRLADTSAEYEPYKKQTLAVVTPNGLNGIGEYRDYIDFALGVRVQRIGVIESYEAEPIQGSYLSSTGELSTGAQVQYVLAEPVATPMTAEELAAYAVLHTNKPNTVVTNDAGAEMTLSYVADTKLYIDNKFNELAAAIVACGGTL